MDYHPIKNGLPPHQKWTTTPSKMDYHPSKMDYHPSKMDYHPQKWTTTPQKWTTTLKNGLPSSKMDYHPQKWTTILKNGLPHPSKYFTFYQPFLYRTQITTRTQKQRRGRWNDLKSCRSQINKKQRLFYCSCGRVIKYSAKYVHQSKGHTCHEVKDKADLSNLLDKHKVKNKAQILKRFDNLDGCSKVDFDQQFEQDLESIQEFSAQEKHDLQATPAKASESIASASVPTVQEKQAMIPIQEVNDFKKTFQNAVLGQNLGLFKVLLLQRSKIEMYLIEVSMMEISRKHPTEVNNFFTLLIEADQNHLSKESAHVIAHTAFYYNGHFSHHLRVIDKLGFKSTIQEVAASLYGKETADWFVENINTTDEQTLKFADFFYGKGNPTSEQLSQVLELRKKLQVPNEQQEQFFVLIQRMIQWSVLQRISQCNGSMVYDLFKEQIDPFLSDRKRALFEQLPPQLNINSLGQELNRCKEGRSFQKEENEAKIFAEIQRINGSVKGEFDLHIYDAELKFAKIELNTEQRAWIKYLYLKAKNARTKKIILELPAGSGKSRIMVILGLLLGKDNISQRVVFKYYQQELMQRDRYTYSCICNYFARMGAKYVFTFHNDSFQIGPNDTLLIDEVDYFIFNQTKEFFGLKQPQIVGFSANVATTDELPIEQQLIKLFEFKILHIKEAQELEYTKVQSNDILKDVIHSSAVLVYTEEEKFKEFLSSIPYKRVVKDFEVVKRESVPFQPGDLILISKSYFMRGFDFRTDTCLTLFIDKAFSNKREGYQALGRVGRFGDQCKRYVVKELVDQEQNFSYWGHLNKTMTELKGGFQQKQQKLTAFGVKK